jgi:hypothetical protein
MLGLDLTVVVAQRQALGVGQRLLEFSRQLVETHDRRPPFLKDYSTNEVFRPPFQGPAAGSRMF